MNKLGLILLHRGPSTMPLYVHYKTNQDFYLLKTNSNECRFAQKEKKKNVDIYIIIFVRKGRQEKLSLV